MSAGLVTVATNLPWGAIFENAPRVFEKATQLVQSLRSSRAEIPVDVKVVSSTGAAADAASVDAAIKELEDSLTLLNQQMIEAGSLIQGLAENNRLIGDALAKQRLFSWVAITFSLVSLILACALWLR